MFHARIERMLYKENDVVFHVYFNAYTRFINM